MKPQGVLRAGMHPLHLPDEHVARSSSVRAIWLCSSAAIRANRLGSTIRDSTLAVRQRASPAKWRTLASGTSANTAVPAPCAANRDGAGNPAGGAHFKSLRDLIIWPPVQTV